MDDKKDNIIPKRTIKFISHSMISYYTYEIQKNESRIKKNLIQKKKKHLKIQIKIIYIMKKNLLISLIRII